MNQLISIRTNIFYTKKDKKDKKIADEYVRHKELIFLVDKPTYRYSNEGEIIRERSLEEVRLSVSDFGFEQLMKILEKIKDADESQFD